tara:strand:+ start:10524 stop:10904 length:381 start_codon:yes stop_codon:yes gene_type:complete
MAINEKRKSGDQLVDKVIFVDVTLWGKTAELASQYLEKGSSALIEGKLDLDQWEERDTGKKRSKLKVIGLSIQFGSRPGDNGNGQRQPPAGQGQPPASQPGQKQQPPSQTGGPDVSTYAPDDDIPF